VNISNLLCFNFPVLMYICDFERKCLLLIFYHKILLFRNMKVIGMKKEKDMDMAKLLFPMATHMKDNMTKESVMAK